MWRDAIPTSIGGASQVEPGIASKPNRMMTAMRENSFHQHHKGQSMIEFALILPLMVLVVVGMFELGRAFFAYISVTNAAREGARLFTFAPTKIEYDQIINVARAEIGPSFIDASTPPTYEIRCGSSHTQVYNTVQLRANCLSGQPIRVTVLLPYKLILGFFSGNQLTLSKSIEMMVP